APLPALRPRTPARPRSLCRTAHRGPAPASAATAVLAPPLSLRSRPWHSSSWRPPPSTQPDLPIGRGSPPLNSQQRSGHRRCPKWRGVVKKIRHFTQLRQTVGLSGMPGWNRTVYDTVVPMSDVRDQFSQMAARDPIPLARGALLIAKEEYPGLDVDDYLAQIADLAREGATQVNG